MIAMKFGGSSVGSADRILNVAHIIESFRNKKPMVVISAMGGVTDLLLDAADDYLNRRKREGEKKLGLVRTMHLEAIETLIKNPVRRAEVSEVVGVLLHQAQEISDGIYGTPEKHAYYCNFVTKPRFSEVPYLLRELSPRSLALISSLGEQMSVPILAATLNEIGVSSQPFDTFRIVRTDDNYLSASVDMPMTLRNFKRMIGPSWRRGIVPVITGFIGTNMEGVTTTLGRGGSDYTGSIVGAAFDAEEIWIWTDVSGVFSADPRVVSDARVLHNISYQEASEMSYFGAKVIHPKTMLPAVAKKIPIRIKNTFDPSDSGTLISAQKRRTHPVRVVTAIKKLSLVSVQGSGMIGISGITARIFSAADRVRVHILMFSQASSGYNMCLVASEAESFRLKMELEQEFQQELKRGELSTIGLQKDVAVVSIVGGGMRGTPGISGTLFSSLGKRRVNIMAIAQGNSELNISFVLAAKDADRAVRVIHDAFGLSKR